MRWLSDRQLRKRMEAERARWRAALAAGDGIKVRQGEIRDLVAERLPEFERVRENRFVAPAERDGEFRVIEVRALKGMCYALWWGVSLPYVGKPHRTAKAARLDLFEQGDVGAGYDFAEDGLVWFLRSEVEAMVADARARATVFWARTATPAGVAEVALEQATGDGRYHDPPPQEVARLAAAR